MPRFFRKSPDQKEKKDWKCKDFKKWIHSYNDYQKLPVERRHEFLLSYFKDAMLIPRDTNKVTADLMRFIRENPIISDPSLIGGHASHNKKRLASLRQCFTAEFLHVLEIKDIKDIDKDLVVHHRDEERESKRRKEIIELGGDDFEYSTLVTPCLARKRESFEGKKRKASNTSPNATPKSKEEKNTTMAKKLTSGIKAIIMTPLQNMFSRKKRPTDYDNDNNFVSPKRRRVNDDDNLSRLIANTTKSPLATIEDKNEESTAAFSPNANEISYSPLSNDGHFSTNSDVESGESPPPSTPNANQVPVSNDREPSSSSESNSSPESNVDNTGRSSSAVVLGPRQIRNIGADVYSLLEEKSKGRPDTMTRTLEYVLRQVNKDSNLTSSLHLRSKEDEMNSEIVHSIRDTLNHEMFKTRGRRKHETNKALIAMLSCTLPNKNGFVIFGNGKKDEDHQGGRDRDHLSDEEYSTIKLPFNDASMQCSKDTISRYQERFSGTSFDSFQSGELVLPMLNSRIDKETNMIVETIALPFGRMYCASDAIDECKYRRFCSTTTGAVQKQLDFRSTLFEKAEESRTALDNGTNLYEDEKDLKQSLRWDNIDSEIEESVYNFGHDPTYVSPDNYCKTKYTCKDESGRPCKHNRSNWCLNGDKHMQLKLYLESEHFSKLKSQILRERPRYAVKFTDEFFLKKVNFRKFCRFLPNCVKPETRASCVDPIEAEAFDFSRGLQLFFRGIKSNMKPVAQEAYYQLNGGIDLYDPNAESDDGDSESDTDEVEFVSDTSELRKAKVEKVISASREFYDRLDSCTCEFCRDGKGWLDVFSNIKGRRPHIALLDYMLCERTPQPELSIQGEKIFQMHNYKCACLECEQCGLDKLPFTCPITKSEHKIKLWIWDKSKGDNERTKKVEMPICEVFIRLRNGLEKFSRHNHLLHLFSRFRSLEIHRLSIPPSLRTDVLGNYQRKRDTVILTDFSAQIDMVPIRKVNCHVNKHASLDIFVQFFQNFVDIDGEVIYYVECWEWYFFGGCEEKGKQNDWVMHNVSFNAIFEDPEIVGLKFAIVKAISDNSPYQYKCRQNFWQLVLKTLLLLHISRIYHNFAKQYGFKNRSDTCGHFIKIGVEKMKSEMDMEPQSAVQYAQLAHIYVNKEYVRPTIELLLEKHKNGEISPSEKDKLKKMLKDKSPYACTKRRIAYVEDNKEEADKCKKYLKKSHPGLLVVYSDRTRMKEEEDCNAIDDTTAYYSFSHKREDDGKSYESFPVLNQTVEGKFLCRVCRKEFGSDGKPFKDHEEVCKHLVEQKQKHCLYMRFYDCSCNQCADENFDQCPYKEYAGEEKETWIHSEKDEASAKAILKAQREISQQQEIIAHATEAMNKMKEYNGNYPPIRDTVDLKKNHWSAITSLCHITVTRNDGKTSAPTIEHRKNALADRFVSWEPLLETLEQAIALFQNDMNDA